MEQAETRMAINYGAVTRQALSTQIADAIRAAIIDGRLLVDERLPSEAELAERFAVSRPTVREALKRLAAQNLIRTERGAAGGAFVNRISWSEAQAALVTTTRLLIGMNRIDLDSALEARQALVTACLPLAAARRTEAQLAAMREEISLQHAPDLDDAAFCDSDVRFHRAIAEAAGNPVLSYQMAGIVEAMLPLMNMITYRARDRKRVAGLHETIAAALEARDAPRAAEAVAALVADLGALGAAVRADRAKRQA